MTTLEFPKRLLTLALMAALTACTKVGGDAPVAAPSTGPSPEAATAVSIAATPSDPTDAIASDELKTLAALALRQQQLHSPAGANAIEYYLALRQRAAKPDALIESALFDLMPYAVIAAERAVEQVDMTELERLRGLIARIDPRAPALPRLEEKLAEGRQAERLAQQRARDAELAAAAVAAAPRPAPASEPAARSAASDATVRDRPTPESPAARTEQPAATAASPAAPLAGEPARVAPAAAMGTPASSAAPAQVQAVTQLVPVRTPQPPFPAEAKRRGQPGSVDIEFVVDRDGSVTDVRVLSSSKRVFERPVLLTVRRWQFEPLASPMTVRRNFTFTPRS